MAHYRLCCHSAVPPGLTIAFFPLSKMSPHAWALGPLSLLFPLPRIPLPQALCSPSQMSLSYPLSCFPCLRDTDHAWCYICISVSRERCLFVHRLLSASHNDRCMLRTDWRYLLNELVHLEAFTSLRLLGVPPSGCATLMGAVVLAWLTGDSQARHLYCIRFTGSLGARRPSLARGSPRPRNFCPSQGVPVWEVDSSGAGAVEGAPSGRPIGQSR